MTIENTANRVTFAGTGSAGPFPISLDLFATGDLQLTKKTDVDGSFVPLIETTDYVVTLTDPGNLPTSASVTLTATLDAGFTLIVDRFIDFLQQTDYPTGGKFPAKSHETALDRAAVRDQQIAANGGFLSYDVTKTEFINLLSTNLDAWDVDAKVVSNGIDPVTGTDLATKNYVDGAVTGGGNLPPSTANNDMLVGNGSAFLVKTAAEFSVLFGGDGIKEVAGQFALDLAATPGLEISAGSLRTTALLRDIANSTPAAGVLYKFDGANLSVFSPTAGDLLIGDATPEWNPLAIGSTDQILTVSGGVPVWGQVPSLAVAAGNRVLLASATASASASLDFTTGIDSTYDHYILELLDIKAATSTAYLAMRVSDDAGSSFFSGGTDYSASVVFNDEGNTAPQSAGQAGNSTTMNLSSNIAGDKLGNGATNVYSGEVHIVSPDLAATQQLKIRGWGGYQNDSARVDLVEFSGRCLAAGLGAVDGFQILMSTGNITSGTVKLYGVKK